jgi:hypothetical protein
MELCELCRFHPATQRVVVADENGDLRTMPVCSVHRHIAERKAPAGVDAPNPARAVSSHRY